jgi:hypothetical protein
MRPPPVNSRQYVEIGSIPGSDRREHEGNLEIFPHFKLTAFGLLKSIRRPRVGKSVADAGDVAPAV